MIVGEPREEHEPVVQISTFVNDTHFLLVVGDDLYKVTHDVWEESDSAKHNNDRQNPLNIAYREVVAIPYSWERGESEVATDD